MSLPNQNFTVSESALRDIAQELGTQTLNRLLLSDTVAQLQGQLHAANAALDDKASKTEAPPRNRSRGKRSPA